MLYFLTTVSVFAAVAAGGEDKITHPPYKMGCETCHTPDFKSLISKIPDLCYGCHDKLDSKAHVHNPVKEGLCTACHHPHESPNPKLILSPIPDLCYGCHNKMDSKAHVHDPVKAGMCASCHDPHASSNFRMLKGEFPIVPYAGFDTERYSLCFTCHDSKVFILSTDLTTGFRDGNKNLHYIHVNGNKGRTCKVCHDPHASKTLKLMKETFSFGNWNQPINFEKRNDGGSCSAVCHMPKTYRR